MDELPTPITRSEQYLAKIAGNEPTLPVPITREERYLAKIAGEDVDIPPEPITRTEQYLAAIAENGGGVEVEALSATQNITYTAPEGKAYSPVTVNVPNSYAAGDEGKVVSGGALVSQTSDTVTQNGTVDTTIISSLEVNVSGGGSEAPEKDVNFIDYDGTILYSYTADEFAALDALPANPTHEGLTAQGWNYNKAQITAEVAEQKRCNIGQMYVPTDGKTKIYVHFEKSRSSPYLGVGVNGTVEIDWGDGSTADTLTGTSLSTVKTIQHIYSPGDYVIKLTVSAGSFAFFGVSNTAHILKKSTSTSSYISNVYLNAIKRIELGNNASVEDYAFQGCASLKSITIPNSITGIGSYAFYGCVSLKSITIPNSVTNIALSAFYGCVSLKSITIPNSVTSVAEYTFQGCSTLKNIVIPKTITTIGNNAFNGARSLSHITIPDSVTNISGNAFVSCLALASVVVSASITNISGGAFSGCYGVGAYHFRANTPPTIDSSTFTNIQSDCIIYVPYSADHSVLEAYKSATYWSSQASKMQEEPD